MRFLFFNLMQTSPHFDVIVCGGGPAGVAAALAASRRGARTLLLERYGFCGGMATAALVNPFAGHEYVDPGTRRRGSLIGGIFRETVLALRERGGYGSALSVSCFDEELLKRVYDSLLVAAGVTVCYHTQLLAACRERGCLVAVDTFSKGGRQRYSGAAFIDCTGDADLAAYAGVPFSVGRQCDGLTQAMTVSFRMANVDKSEMIRTGDLKKARALVEPYFQDALTSGRLHYPYRNFVHFYDYPRPGVLHFNMTRINLVSGLSAADLTKAEIEGRRQAYLIGEWLVAEVPWFRGAHVEKVACQVGVRETRHIQGIHTMTGDAIREARKFADGIVRSCYFIDIHNPVGSQDVHQITGARGAVRAEYGPPPGDYYEVPYRSIVTPACPNLLVACRALSATHEASAAIRVMATMHGIGEAAGIAAAESVKRGVSAAELPGEWVRGEIAYLSEPADFAEPWTGQAPTPGMEWPSKGGGA